MADKRQPSRRPSSNKQTGSQKQTVSRHSSPGTKSGSQRPAPSRRPDMIRCENCGEDYSSTYKRCPFCDERPGRTGIGGRRVAGGGSRQVHPVQLVGLIVSLILIISALFIVITRVAPLLMGKDDPDTSISTSQSGAGSSHTDGSSSGSGQSDSSNTTDGSSSTPNGSSSSSQETPPSSVTSITLGKTDMTLQPGETTQLTATLAPAGASGTITWSSSDTSLVTVDEYGNIKNVNQGTEKKKAVITASCGSVTATCDVYCKPANTSSGTEEPNNGNSTSGNASGPVAANTPGTITNAGNGLNVRSGPGSSYDKIASVKNGDQIIVLEDTGSGWYKVDIGGGVTGYVSSQYVKTK